MAESKAVSDFQTTYALIDVSALGTHDADVERILQLPRGAQTDCFRAHCANLDPSKIPPTTSLGQTSLSATDVRKRSRGLFSLAVIGRVCRLDANLCQEPAIAQILDTEWEHFVAWMQYFCSTVDVSVHDQTTIQWVVRGITGLLLYRLQDEPLAQTIRDDRRMVRIGLKTWSLSKEQESDPMQYYDVGLALTEVLATSRPSLLDEMNEELKGRFDLFIRVVAGRLAVTLKHKKVWPTSTLVHLIQNAYAASASYDSLHGAEDPHPMGVEIINARTTPLVIRALRMYPRVLPAQEHILISSRAIMHLHLTFTHRGYFAIRESIDLGFLPALLDNSQAYHVLKNDMNPYNLPDTWLDHNAEIFSCYLIIPSFLHAVKPFIAEWCSPTSTAKALDRYLTVPIKEFRRLALHRLYIRAANKIVTTLSCENDQCQERYSTLKRCAACHISLYCSKECQKKAWVRKGKSHRAECRGFQAHLKERGFPSLSQRDHSYIQAVMTRDAHRKLQEIRTEAHRSLPGIPLKRLSIYLNYSVDPPAYTALPLPVLKRVIRNAQWEYGPPPVTDTLISTLHDENKTLLIAQLSLGQKFIYEMCAIDTPWNQEIDFQIARRCREERLSRDGYDLYCQANKFIPGQHGKTELSIPKLDKLMNIILAHERADYLDKKNSPKSPQDVHTPDDMIGCSSFSGFNNTLKRAGSA